MDASARTHGSTRVDTRNADGRGQRNTACTLDLAGRSASANVQRDDFATPKRDDQRRGAAPTHNEQHGARLC
eukprot:4470642-Alexandrium_andersonii.AAC.1